MAFQGWTHNPICRLCRNHPETISHLYRDCSFTKEVWSFIQSWDPIPPTPHAYLMHGQ